GGPTGVLLTRRLDRAITYRLTLHGMRKNAAPALRLRFDAGAYVWRTVDRGDGDLDIVLPNASRVEALLYSDAPFAFDVRRLSVEPCTNCMTDAQFAERVRHDAGIRPQDGPRIIARKLRDWVANTVVFGQEPRTVAITTSAVMSEPAWQSYVDFFVPRRGGVWCAGIARFYQQVLALFDLPAVTLDVGYDGTDLTHVTDVLVAREDGRRRFYVFDPTFAATYVDGHGADVDLLALVGGRPAR